MKTYRLSPGSQQGNTLLLTIVITGLLGFLLAAYLTLVQSQNSANVRSQSWNSAMPVVEAGIEDGMQHLNKNGMTNGNLAVDGWTGSGSSYTVTRSLGDAFYSVTISAYNPGTLSNAPIVESKGYVVMPLVLASAQSALLATVGGQGATMNYLGRGVRVNTRQDFIFTKGMVAKLSIDMNGNNVRTDSFDSTDARYSTNGMYLSGKTRDNGDVAVNASVTNSLSVGNADIHGHVSVGPNGTISIGAQGSVGSDAWRAAGGSGLQAGWSKNDMNVSFPDVAAPFNGGAFTPSGGWITNTTSTVTPGTNLSTSYSFPSACGGIVSTSILTTSSYPSGHPGPVTTNYNGAGHVTGYTYPSYSCSTPTSTTNTTSTATYYDYILDGANYQLSSLSGTIYVRGDAVLYVTSSLNVSALVIKSGASLNLYSSAPSVGLAGNNTANSDGTAESFAFWGMPTVTSITFSGNAGFTGTIYAPNADLTLNGGGNNTTDFIGASITKTARLNGHFNFHYDEALAKIGPFRGYIVNAWNEMTPNEVPRLTITSH